MEDILTERFNFATIVAYKDYCKLSDKKRLSEASTSNLNAFDDDLDLSSWPFTKRERRTPENQFNWYQGRLITLPEKKKKKGKVFFYTCDDDVQEKFPIEYVYVNKKKINSFDTQKESQIIRHYGRSFSEITVHTVERSIRRHGDKITIKLYHGWKHRGFNCIHFKKRFRVDSITIDLVKGNFTTGTINKMGKSNTKSFRCNSFMALYQILSNSLNPFRIKDVVSSDNRLKDEYLSSFNDMVFTTKIQEVLSITNGHINYSLDPKAFMDDFVKRFVEIKNIKVPNGDFSYWVTRFYPTEKYLKKNDRKLVASILDMFDVRSKSTVKILHENPDIDFGSFVNFCRYFGKDYSKYIGNLKSEALRNAYRKSNPSNYNDWLLKSSMKYNNKVRYFLTDTEKENLIKVANSYTNSCVLSDREIQLFDDHFNMINKIRDYDPDIYMKARTQSEFTEEHRELSKMVAAIKKGWVVEYQYDQRTLDEIEKPLECLYDDETIHQLYPTILKREEDYVEEGSFMHHCVASYSNKDKSMIVSVRTEDSKDRVTCEFDIQTGRCIQKRHFCNAEPPKHFINGLEILEGTIIKLARWGILNWKEKKKVPVKINGIEIPENEIYRNATDLFNIQLPF